MCVTTLHYTQDQGSFSDIGNIYIYEVYTKIRSKDIFIYKQMKTRSFTDLQIKQFVDEMNEQNKKEEFTFKQIMMLR